MTPPRRIATRFAYANCRQRRKLAADFRSELVNGTADCCADSPVQGDATKRRRSGAPHTGLIGSNLLGQP
jgi:hypothetical protein